MLFQQVLGHSKIKQHLIAAHQAERTAHAQIFVSKEGNGALGLALAYAQYILCQNPSDTDACGSCSACRKNKKMVHPDVHFSYPTIGSKKISTDFIQSWRTAVLTNYHQTVNQWLESIGAENQQGNINKDECVSIAKRLRLKATEGGYKIMILWLPEYLGKEGNRLLKLIEEPRPNTLFILVSEQAEKIINTILSRCQLVNIPRLDDDLIKQKLQSQFGLESANAQRIAYLAEGNYNKAMQLIEEIDNNNSAIFLDWLRVTYLGKPKDMVQWVEAVVSGKHPNKDFFKKMGRKDQITLLNYALYFFKEFLSLKLGKGELVVRLEDKELQTAQNMLKIIDLQQIQQLISLFDEMAFHVERNANPRILFLDASIQMHHILRKPSKLL